MGASVLRPEGFLLYGYFAVLATAAFYALMLSLRHDVEPISLESDWELDRELVCNEQCDSAGYEIGSEEYMGCIARCIAGQ